MHNYLQKGVCPRCTHFKSCQSPCYPIEQYLAENNLSVYEKSVTTKEGETVSIIFARSREMPESELPQSPDGDAVPADQRIFSTENESPFAGFSPRLKQTGIFIDRFFHKFSYEDLGVKYGMGTENAVKTYHNALKRVFAVLQAMDKANRVGKFDAWEKMVAKRSGTLPKGQKWFLLNKLFGLRPSQIAAMEGLKGSAAVRGLIIRVSDQLRSGEIRLIDATPQEASEARKRLDEQRKKRRLRHSKKKSIKPA